MKLKLTFWLLCFSLSIVSSAATFSDTTIVVNGTSRSVLLSVPDNYNQDTQYPLIIGLHYCGGSPGEYRNKLKALTDSLEIIVACPDYNSTQLPSADTTMFQILADTANSLFNINYNEVYLTGMSCNAEYILRVGLKSSFPFKGIFPWAPWVDSSSPKTYNFDTDIPTVISIGTLDTKLKATIQIYDSLKNHGADVNFIVVPNVGHTLNFGEFKNTMYKSIDYVKNKSELSIQAIDNFSLISSETKEITFLVENSNNKDITLAAHSSHPSKIPAPEIETTDNTNEYKMLIDPNNKSGKVCIIIELIEAEKKAINQATFIVDLEEVVNIKTNELASLNAYPNPVQNKLIIENIEPNSSVQLIDMAGKLFYNGFSEKTEMELQLDIPEGMYIIKASNEKSVQTTLINKAAK